MYLNSYVEYSFNAIYVQVFLSDDIKISGIIHISCDKVGVAERLNKSRVDFHVKDVLY